MCSTDNENYLDLSLTQPLFKIQIKLQFFGYTIVCTSFSSDCVTRLKLNLNLILNFELLNNGKMKENNNLRIFF